MDDIARAGRGLAGVELRHLVALDAIVSERSFKRAAARLHLTQSAISHQIAQLEERVGCVLVDRRAPGGAELTSAGEVIARHAASVLAHLDAAQAELGAQLAGGATVRVGTFPSAGSSILPHTLRRLRDAGAGVHVDVHEDADDEVLLRLVRAGRLDVAFVILPVDEATFQCVELLEDSWYVAVAAGSPLARSVGPLPLRAVAEQPLIGFRHGSPLQLGETRLRMAGYDVDVACRVDDIGTIQGLVAAGLGVAVLPRLLLVVRHPQVAVRPLAEPSVPRRVGLAWSAIGARSAAATMFVDATVDALRQAAHVPGGGDVSVPLRHAEARAVAHPTAGGGTSD
jgi:DNA-binding transcriptional LysR family regulator